MAKIVTESGAIIDTAFTSGPTGVKGGTIVEEVPVQGGTVIRTSSGASGGSGGSGGGGGGRSSVTEFKAAPQETVGVSRSGERRELTEAEKKAIQLEEVEPRLATAQKQQIRRQREAEAEREIIEDREFVERDTAVSEDLPSDFYVSQGQRDTRQSKPGIVRAREMLARRPEEPVQREFEPERYVNIEREKEREETPDKQRNLVPPPTGRVEAAERQFDGVLGGVRRRVAFDPVLGGIVEGVRNVAIGGAVALGIAAAPISAPAATAIGIGGGALYGFSVIRESKNIGTGADLQGFRARLATEAIGFGVGTGISRGVAARRAARTDIEIKGKGRGASGSDIDIEILEGDVAAGRRQFKFEGVRETRDGRSIQRSILEPTQRPVSERDTKIFIDTIQEGNIGVRRIRTTRGGRVISDTTESLPKPPEVRTGVNRRDITLRRQITSDEQVAIERRVSEQKVTRRADDIIDSDPGALIDRNVRRQINDVVTTRDVDIQVTRALPGRTRDIRQQTIRTQDAETGEQLLTQQGREVLSAEITQGRLSFEGGRTRPRGRIKPTDIERYNEFLDDNILANIENFEFRVIEPPRSVSRQAQFRVFERDFSFREFSETRRGALLRSKRAQVGAPDPELQQLRGRTKPTDIERYNEFIDDTVLANIENFEFRVIEPPRSVSRQAQFREFSEIRRGALLRSKEAQVAAPDPELQQPSSITRLQAQRTSPFQRTEEAIDFDSIIAAVRQPARITPMAPVQLPKIAQDQITRSQQRPKVRQDQLPRNMQVPRLDIQPKASQRPQEDLRVQQQPRQDIATRLNIDTDIATVQEQTTVSPPVPVPFPSQPPPISPPPIPPFFPGIFPGIGGPFSEPLTPARGQAPPPFRRAQYNPSLLGLISGARATNRSGIQSGVGIRGI